MIPLVCIDVDGTLVGPTGVVTEVVWDAVDAALQRGQHLALSTARGAFAASWTMAQRLDPNGWHVFHAGGAAVHTGDEAVRAHSLTPDEIDLCVRAANGRGWILELYSATAYSVDSEEPFAVDHAKLIGVPFARTDLQAFRDHEGDIVRAQFVVPEAEIPAVQDAIAPSGLSVTSATSPIMPGAAFVSVTKSGITKATGIAMICEELGVQMHQVMMIGDGLNDLPAIEAVGHPVAMGNAAPKLKEVSRYHVAEVTQDGAAEALELSAELDPES